MAKLFLLIGKGVPLYSLANIRCLAPLWLWKTMHIKVTKINITFTTATSIKLYICYGSLFYYPTYYNDSFQNLSFY